MQIVSEWEPDPVSLARVQAVRRFVLIQEVFPQCSNTKEAPIARFRTDALLVGPMSEPETAITLVESGPAVNEAKELKICYILQGESGSKFSFGQI